MTTRQRVLEIAVCPVCTPYLAQRREILARTTDPDRVIGAKPAAFWRWMFELLGATADDHFTDIFPASGGGDRAWATYASRSTTVRRDA